MRYNSNFAMRDFFANSKLKRIFPQFESEKEINTALSEQEMLDKSKNYLVEAIGGTLQDGGSATVSDSLQKVQTQVETLKYIAEGFYDNIPSIQKNLSKNTKLYTTAASIGQIQEFETPADKLSFMNQILDNLNYNPEFNISKWG